MKADLYTKCVLTTIAVLLAAIMLRPLGAPATAHAQQNRRDLYIEPGVFMLRKPDGSGQMKGKVVVDLTTGNIWGFPTLVDAPYPVDVTKTTPPASHPMLLGSFVFTDISKAQ